MKRRGSRGLQLLLALAAACLAAAPWMRSFPASVAATPLYGAAGISVVLPLLTQRFSRGRRPAAQLAISLGVDLIALLGYLLVVVLRTSGGFGDIESGLVHGPSQLLTFALPLVSPRTLLVAPVALIWLAGAVAGESIARRWLSIAPQCALIIAFALSYAATLRATESSGARFGETVLAATLLGCLLLLRASQVWAAEASTPPGAASTGAKGDAHALTLAGGAAVAAAFGATIVATLVVRSGVFPDRATVPHRIPSVQNSSPLNPLAFIAGLRPADAASTRTAPTLFTVATDAPAPGYIGIANVDSYDGSGWSFTRSFLPSGGVLPADPDAGLTGGRTVNQDYRVLPGALVGAPWLPVLDRAQSVSGLPVNIDPGSGMVVPTVALPAHAGYSVRSSVPQQIFDHLDAASAVPDAATPGIDVELPATLRVTVGRIVAALAVETGVSSSNPVGFLQAIEADFRTHYALAAPDGSPSTPTATPTATPASPTSPTTSSNLPAGSAPTSQQRAGGTGFSDVLASILGEQRTATPEQYATLIALIARDLGVGARVVTGFRIAPPNGSTLLPAGSYRVTAAQAWSWVEVAITGVGWVVLDPSPTALRNLPPDQASGGAATPTSAAPPTGNALVTNNNGNAVGKRSRVPHTSATHQMTLLAVLLSAVALLLVVLSFVLALRKRVRAARRRRAGTPRQRLTSAWDEALDRLCEAGLADGPVLDALTSSEIAELTNARFGMAVASHASTVGAAAETATYRQSRPVGLAQADAAWTAQDQLKKELNRELGLPGRLRAASRYRHRPRVPRSHGSHGRHEQHGS
jgi:hypothetical protein